MKRYFLLIGTLFWVMGIVVPAQARVTVSAVVDRTDMSPQEVLSLQVIVYGDGGKVDVSAIKDFQVHPRGSSSNVQILNNSMSKQVTYNYLLVPQREGKLTIPALKVDVYGQIHRTEPITITVAQQSATDSTRKDVWVTADLSEISPFQGQQTIYTFRLYRAVKTNRPRIQTPEFKGFAVKEIENNRTYRKLINGREYIVVEIYYILTPLKAGPLVIEPAVLRLNVMQQDRRLSRRNMDPFLNRGQWVPRVLQTEELKIAARPLPSLPEGQAFSGLVGQFNMTAEMESTDLKVGDSATLAITIEGEGNIMDAQAPPLKVPSAFKHYTDNPEEDIKLDRRGYRGKKIFRTALVPVKDGVYQLPPIDWVYFDVNQEAYRTLNVTVPPVKVSSSTMAQNAPITVTPDSLSSIKKKQVSFTGRDILPPKESLAAIQSKEPLKWHLFLISLIVPAMAFCGIAVVQRIKRKDTSPSARMKIRAHQALKHAAKSRDDTFFSCLYQALTAAIFSAADRSGEALTWKEAESLLLENGFQDAEATHAAELLSKIESCKFGGSTLAEKQKQDLLNQTQKMVRKLTP